jgi:hypothetical protein
VLQGRVSSGWTFAIDRGGTFTDVIARSPDGEIVVEKLLSENPLHYADAALEAVRRILEPEGGDIAAVRMGTTVATKASMPCHRADARLEIYAHEARLAEMARELGFAQFQRQPRGRTADQAGPARRYDGGRRLSLAGAAPLRRQLAASLPETTGALRSCSRTAGWPTSARSAARTRSCRARPAGGRDGRRKRAAFRRWHGAADRLRHGRHLDRCRHYAGEVRADRRKRGRRECESPRR